MKVFCACKYQTGVLFDLSIPKIACSVKETFGKDFRPTNLPQRGFESEELPDRLYRSSQRAIFDSPVLLIQDLSHLPQFRIKGLQV